MEIVLASQSPRRLEILNNRGIEPLVCPADIDEVLPEGISPRDAVMLLSLNKALACEKQHPENEGKVIIAADTVVWKDRIMGKPKDRDEAIEMITAIRNTRHQVMTGVTVLTQGGLMKRTFCDVTDVFCKDYSDEEIAEYVDLVKPYDKAGAYAIQGEFKVHIDHIEGDFWNVVGLPIDRTLEEIAKL